MKVIAVVGMPGSGKGEFSAIAQDMGIPVVVMGDVIREEVKKQGLPPTDESMGIVARALREKHGMAAIAHVCVPVIMRQEADLVLVDGSEEMPRSYCSLNHSQNSPLSQLRRRSGHGLPGCPNAGALMILWISVNWSPGTSVSAPLVLGER